MTSEHDKGLRELAVFRAFLDASRLPVDRASIEKRYPPEPDIFCMHLAHGGLAFELVELCDPNIAQLIAEARDGKDDAIWTSDPSGFILRKKLRRNYETKFPIHLVCYTDGRIVTPDDVALSNLRPILESLHGVFEQAWFLASGGVHLIYARTNERLQGTAASGRP